ncbi:DUF6544 family protein [Paraglaciecola arctica]|uniref:Uncharacterized protein n=1 Tax=Paraglaciecola arctica BSs20135 TaxID=493475 RepID=K6YP94_9ALTE|nr:DUF6544 family protein [Paraglaciecola arctica]GAC19997.1 hypothetical protein GARC_3034 [Paraglaciecola arctica BSs20135]
MNRFVFTGLACVVATSVAAFLIGRGNEKRCADLLISKLEEAAASSNSIEAIYEIPTDLPAPVARYLRRALPKKIYPIQAVLIEQSGALRTSTSSKNWMDFSARQFVAPMAVGFVWNARVKLPFGIHILVLDSYSFGVGSGRVSLMSAFVVSSTSNEPELNSGALHRYLAESVWYPTALLPQSGVSWVSKDERSAVATLKDHSIEVSLEFRFNDADEVIAVYSPGRYGRFDGEYRKVGWEGHFSNYREQDGFLIPGRGEVGWYDAGELQLVWKGEINSVHIQQNH